MQKPEKMLSPSERLAMISRISAYGTIQEQFETLKRILKSVDKVDEIKMYKRASELVKNWITPEE